MPSRSRLTPARLQELRRKFPGETDTQLIKHDEIAQRHARKVQRSIPPIAPGHRPSDRLRRAEIGRLLSDRYGDGPLPDTADTRRDVVVMLEHLVYLPSKYRKVWIADNAPWCTTAMIKNAMRKGVFLKADPVGQRLCLTSAERAKLEIRTIGAIDCLKDERAELRKKRNMESHRERRAKAGATPRKMSAEQRTPWLDLGISRRTYYSRKKAQNCTCTDSSAIACETSCTLSRDETVQTQEPHPNTQPRLERGAVCVGTVSLGIERDQQPTAESICPLGDSLKEVYARVNAFSVTLVAENVATRGARLGEARLDGRAMAA